MAKEKHFRVLLRGWTVGPRFRSDTLVAVLLQRGPCLFKIVACSVKRCSLLCNVTDVGVEMQCSAVGGRALDRLDWIGFAWTRTCVTD